MELRNESNLRNQKLQQVKETERAINLKKKQ